MKTWRLNGRRTGVCRRTGSSRKESDFRRPKNPTLVDPTQKFYVTVTFVTKNLESQLLVTRLVPSRIILSEEFGIGSESQVWNRTLETLCGFPNFVSFLYKCKTWNSHHIDVTPLILWALFLWSTPSPDPLSPAPGFHLVTGTFLNSPWILSISYLGSRSNVPPTPPVVHCLSFFYFFLNDTNPTLHDCTCDEQ